MTNITRPILNESNLNKSNSRYQRLLKDYKNWCKESGQEEDDFEYEDDIVDILINENHNLDGYRIAKYLEDKLGIDPDTQLVEILDCGSVYSDLKCDLVKQWVDDNNLVIPEEIIGQKINAKVGFRTYKDHYVNLIFKDRYEIAIDTDNTRKGGFVIPYECVELIQEKV